MNEGFIERLRVAFDNASMAEVARRLEIPHATVRNYYHGRLPAPDVLVKIAKETGVSLNWLLMGTGERYTGEIAPIDLGRFLEHKIEKMIEDRIEQIVDQRFNSFREKESTRAVFEPFDVESAVMRHNDPQIVMQDWFHHEGRDFPQDYGIVFFRGWETFSLRDKVAAVIDAKKALDRSLETTVDKSV
jgi:transcriptional regulator with XRE-family HTH domain